jgi:hypothetical protein
MSSGLVDVVPHIIVRSSRLRPGIGNVIICYGAATVYDKHLASTVHCIDDEFIEWLRRRPSDVRPDRRDASAELWQGCRTKNYRVI